MAFTNQSRRRGFRSRWRRISYGLRVGLLLAALGVVVWVYGGDVYVALALAVCAAGLFAYGIAPGLIPPLVWIMARVPFVLGALIPLWQVVDALFKADRDALLLAGATVALYNLSVLVLIGLPRRMRGPFLKWLPAGALPTQELASGRARGAPRIASPPPTLSTARSRPAHEAEGRPRRFGFRLGRAKTADRRQQPAGAPAMPRTASGGVNPFTTSSSAPVSRRTASSSANPFTTSGSAPAPRQAAPSNANPFSTGPFTAPRGYEGFLAALDRLDEDDDDDDEAPAAPDAEVLRMHEERMKRLARIRELRAKLDKMDQE